MLRLERVKTYSFDVCIIGAGIVGLASALALSEKHPGLKIAILDKEKQVAAHQTGHNSGVVHAGIYYKPGSLKAKLCISGVSKMRAFCEAHQLAYERCGKVIVASNEAELPALEKLFERGTQNGVPGIRRIDEAELKTIEPHAAGIAAIHSPNTAIVNYRLVAEAMAEVLRSRNVTFLLGQALSGIEEKDSGLELVTTTGRWQAGFLINCAGLYSDKVLEMMGMQPQVKIIPFRGEYYLLKPEKRHLVKGLIYPVPDPAFPFLGVHLTKMVSGDVEAGPNAVLAFAREGYRMFDINPKEFLETLAYPGLWEIAKKYWKVGAYEYYRSFLKSAFVASLRKLMPILDYDDVVRAGAGVRAQAVAKDGSLVDDFVIQSSEKSMHVLNAPSPAATASLAIGESIAEQCF